MAAHTRMEWMRGAEEVVERRSETLQEYPRTVQLLEAGRLAKGETPPSGGVGDSNEEILRGVQ